MCGISFYCSTKSNFSGELQDSLDVSAHRGPDAQGFVEKKVGKFNLGLGHNRLSIIELSKAGAQPMVGESGATIIYNGEVFNHNEIKVDLKSLGRNFKGGSDTEVVLQLYEEYGIEAFGMLRGMFSFVILDEKANKVFVVRDVVGVKPIYYYLNKQELMVASEIKSLKKFSSVDTDIDINDVYEFFNNGFLYEPSTGFKYIKKLNPGHYLELNLVSGLVEISRYKNISAFSSDLSTAAQVKKAIEKQRFSDVPLGVFFSGGADSSILATFAENEELFFAKYESDPSADVDLKYSKLISEHLSRKLVVSELSSGNDVEELLYSVDFVAKNTEELISDYTFWATYKLSQAARNNGYKVMLSGMGGDEIFAGYPRYLVLKQHVAVKLLSPLLKIALQFKIFPKKFNKKFERLVSYSMEHEWCVAYSRMLGYFSRNELKAMFKGRMDAAFVERMKKVMCGYKGDKTDKVKVAQYMDLTGFLSHNLMVSDKASMLASIELRVPLLDESLVALGLNMSTDQMIKNNQTKYPLKKLLSTVLPKKLIDRPKTGFNPPLDSLIHKIGKERLSSEFSSLKSLSDLGLDFDLETVGLIVDDHFSKVSNNTYKLWQLLYFSRWLKHNRKKVNDKF